jgi:hypothetical protein
MSSEASTSADPVNGGERGGIQSEKTTPNGKDLPELETFVESPVDLTKQYDNDNGEQRTETRLDARRRVQEDHQDSDSTDDESDEEQDEDEDEEDDEDEPSLKYQRIAGEIPDLLKKDSASALAISNKTMVIPLYFAPATIFIMCF